MTTVAERFFAKVDLAGDCWLWLGASGNGGYGQFSFRGTHRAAHRVAYELLVGPIPDGLQIDHLCRTPPCVNPAHLEPVTQRENILRSTSPVAVRAAQTHCVAGHEYDTVNTHYRLNGTRYCRACARRRANENYRRRKASA